MEKPFVSDAGICAPAQHSMVTRLQTQLEYSQITMTTRAGQSVWRQTYTVHVCTETDPLLQEDLLADPLRAMVFMFFHLSHAKASC